MNDYNNINFQVLLSAIKFNDVKQIAIQCTEHNVDVNNNNIYELFYGTPLHYACKRGCSSKTIKVLLLAGANIDCKDYYGETPIYEAIRNTNLNIVKLLLKCGADIYTKNDFNETPLCIAKNMPAVYKLLVPYTKGHKKWMRIKPIIFTIGVLSRSYKNTVEKMWCPDGSGYNECKNSFESSQSKQV